MNISRNIPIFLIATILVFGTTISMGIPKSFAQSYEESYGKDYDKKKSTSKDQKIKCTNSNINVNGSDVNQKHDLNGLAPVESQGLQEENGAGIANVMNSNGEGNGLNLED